MSVREPSACDIDAAFRVFDETHLTDAVHTLPQVRLGWVCVGGLWGLAVRLWRWYYQQAMHSQRSTAQHKECVTAQHNLTAS